MKVSIDAVSTGGQTPLHIAAKWGRLAVINTLVESGANVTVTAIVPAPFCFRSPSISLVDSLLGCAVKQEKNLVLSAGAPCNP